MIGTQPTNTIAGVEISAVANEGLTVTVNGRPGTLAVLNEAGQIVAAGPQVAREAQAVLSINLYRAFWQGLGHLRVRAIVQESSPGERGK